MDIAVASKPATRPRMLMCYLCGREFGSKSLPIHTPQCQKKWLDEEAKKPRKDRRPLPEPPTDALPASGTVDSKAVDEFNELMYQTWEDKILEKCEFCGRTFRPEALRSHHKSCSAEHPAKPAGTGLTSASLSNHLAPGAISGTRHVAAPADHIQLPRTSIPGASTSVKASPVSDLRASLPSLKDVQGGMKVTRGAVSKAAAGRGRSVSPQKAPAVGLRQGRVHPVPDEGSQLTKPDKVAGIVALARFCDECGVSFPRETSKFCAECGAKRPGMC